MHNETFKMSQGGKVGRYALVGREQSYCSCNVKGRGYHIGPTDITYYSSKKKLLLNAWLSPIG